jgi:SAM-dependent methyltransferase
VSLFYRLAYLFGFTPWEEAATHPPAVRHITRLFQREERGRQPPYGRALDLGCGAGHWTISLAQRGWEVTGVDLVPRAVRAARAGVAKAGVGAEIIEGDVTDLRNAGVGTGFRLIWDFGTVHGLSRSQRDSVARGVDAIATDDAVVLLLAWTPARRGPLPNGMSRHDIESSFRHWRVTDEEPFDATGLPRPLRHVDPRVYRLRRAQPAQPVV